MILIKFSQLVQNVPEGQGRDPGLISGSERSPGEGSGKRLQYSCLENPLDRGAWWATVHGVPRVGHDLVTKPPLVMNVTHLLNPYIIIGTLLYGLERPSFCIEKPSLGSHCWAAKLLPESFLLICNKEPKKQD